MKTFNDISPFEGVYSDFIVLKENELVTIIQTDGVNLDQLSSDQVDELFDKYGEFISTYVLYKPQNVSMAIPVVMTPFLNEWKQRFIDTQNDPNLTNDMKQLVASYLYEYQQLETDTDTSVKAHFVVIKEKLKQPTLEELRVAETRLNEKREEIISGLNELLAGYDCASRVLNGNEASHLMHQFLDYKTSIYHNK
ncbi:hypothetical protein [Bacillus pumilus]|uniref:hypothetical protein n=1 Tax=Bacillus pumilus TaxID=1408 RepID=UPI00119FDA4E|nr:hypothetical protein [Bacillus pumilus]